MVKAFAPLRVRRAMWVLWPGFLSAIIAETAFFAIFDPLDFNARLGLTREAVYTFGFIAFWLLGMLSSALTLYLQGAAPAGGEEEPLA
jgi:hypothetical protein